jgi:Transposase DDE domain
MADNTDVTALILERFAARSPLTVMAQQTLQHVFAAPVLDAVFDAHAESQYTRELTFSAVVTLMSEVVLKVRPSVRQAYHARQEALGVTLQAVYDKLAGIDPSVCSALVGTLATRAGGVLAALPDAAPPAWKGYRLRVLDGNHQAATQRRIKKLRGVAAGPRPSFGVVVYDPQHDLPLAFVPCEDAYVQERALAGHFLPLAAAGDCWLGDRNFCTTTILFGWDARGAAFVVREHANAPVRACGPLRHVGTIESGTVYEQDAELLPEDRDHEALVVRRIVVRLTTPTRDGATELVLLTTVPAEVASACELAELYRTRWTIETAFLRLATLMQTEIAPLGYPRAALLGFAVGLVAYMVVSVLRGALRAAHGAAAIDALSWFAVTEEIEQTMRGLEVAVPEAAWVPSRTATAATLAAALVALAHRVLIVRYLKAPTRKRSAATRPTPRTRHKNRPHVSTFRLLNDLPQKSD